MAAAAPATAPATGLATLRWAQASRALSPRARPPSGVPALGISRVAPAATAQADMVLGPGMRAMSARWTPTARVTVCAPKTAMTAATAPRAAARRPCLPPATASSPQVAALLRAATWFPVSPRRRPLGLVDACGAVTMGPTLWPSAHDDVAAPGTAPRRRPAPMPREVNRGRLADALLERKQRAAVRMATVSRAGRWSVRRGGSGRAMNGASGDSRLHLRSLLSTITGGEPRVHRRGIDGFDGEGETLREALTSTDNGSPVHAWCGRTATASTTSHLRPQWLQPGDDHPRRLRHPPAGVLRRLVPLVVEPLITGTVGLYGLAGTQVAMVTP